MSTDQKSISASNLFKYSVGPVELEYAKDWTKAFPGEKEFYYDYGFSIRATAETGEDFHLWTFMYNQNNQDALVLGDLCQTALLITNFSDKEKKLMHPTPFIDKGQNVEDNLPLGSLTCEKGDNSYVWKIDGRVFTAEKDNWRITGEHAGVKTDIRLTQPGQGFFHLGRFEDWKEDGTAGYSTHTKAEGEITVHGRTFKIKGYAVHENLGIRGTTVGVPDRIKYMGMHGHNWVHAFSDEFSWYMLANTAGKRSTGMVTINGEVLAASTPQNVWFEIAEEWLDPQSKQIVPRKWRAYIRTEKGTLEAEMVAYGRSYWTWNRRGGVIIVYALVGQTSSTFTYNDGRVLSTPKQLSFVEHMRTLHDRGSQLQSLDQIL